MIEVRELTKRYGAKTAVDGLTFTVRPGIVTGFLGPNGAGKSTTMRMIMGLDRPTSGRATINGRPYDRLEAPLHEVGALLDCLEHVLQEVDRFIPAAGTDAEPGEVEDGREHVADFGHGEAWAGIAEDVDLLPAQVAGEGGEAGIADPPADRFSA